tara:strand:+ start:15874 stop:16074 length:201 start_codon:yes stop_codon:yes gene_type:complete
MRYRPDLVADQVTPQPKPIIGWHWFLLLIFFAIFLPAFVVLIFIGVWLLIESFLTYLAVAQFVRHK